MATQQKVFRFYRSNLASVVWDPDKDKALCEFIKGQYYTEDPVVADKLRNLGYPEVPLDANTPPDILYAKGKSLADGEHAQALPPGLTEEAALQKEQLAAQQAALAAKAQGTDAETKTNVKTPDQSGGASDSDGPSPADIVAKAQKKAANVAKKKPAAKRKIARRTKK